MYRVYPGLHDTSLHINYVSCECKENAMPFVPALDTVQLEVTLLLEGQRIQNVYHYTVASSVTPVNMLAFANDYVNYWDVNWKGWYPTTVSLIEVKVTDLNIDTGPVVFATASLPIVGTRVGAALPNNCALVLTKRTIKRGRSFRGRTYFGPLCEPDVTANAVSGTFVSGAITRMQGQIEQIVGAETWTMCVLSRISDGAYRDFAETEPVIAISSDGLVDSQRRRLPGRGS